MTQHFTLPQVAELLGVSRRTVEREIAAGHLRAVHIRRAVRVTEAEVKAYIAAVRRAA